MANSIYSVAVVNTGALIILNHYVMQADAINRLRSICESFSVEYGEPNEDIDEIVEEAEECNEAMLTFGDNYEVKIYVEYNMIH